MTTRSAWLRVLISGSCALLVVSASAEEAVPAPVQSPPAESASSPVSTTPEPAQAVAPVQAAPADPDSSESQFREFRERYASRKWRIGSLGGFAGSFGVHRRFGARSGLGLTFFGAYFDDPVKSGYAAGGLAVTWWRERANRLFPAVVGWSLSFGPMGSVYTVMHHDKPFAVASAAGLAGSGSIYAILPVFNMLFDARPHGWLPHLTIELSMYHGQVGKYRNDGTTDVDGDGIADYKDGESFTDPGGGTARKFFGLGGTGGLIWIF